MKQLEYQLGNLMRYKGAVVELDSTLLGKHLLDLLDAPLEPILIDNHWLWRLGFREKGSNFYVTLDSNVFAIYKKNGFFDFGVIGSDNAYREVMYVHEMQNLTRFLGNFELKISINTEVLILEHKLFGLSPIDQHIEILKKQIELYTNYDDKYKAQLSALLSTLEGLELKK